MGNCVPCLRQPVNRPHIVRKPRPWEFTQYPLSRVELNELRTQFWAHLPPQGTPEKWNVIRQACEILLNSEEDAPPLATTIMENAGFVREFPDLRVCYDPNGPPNEHSLFSSVVRYDVPLYLQSDPTNLIEN